jgi:Zn-dependent protease with chaperone function
MSGLTGFLNLLGWSLLNGIWQMAGLWLAYYTLTAGNRRISPAGKHNLAIMFVAMGTGWFFYGLLNESPHNILPDFVALPRFADSWISGLAGIYLLILMVRLLQYALHSVKKHKTQAGRFISPVLQSFADRHVKLMGITRQVRVYLSDLAETAQTSGFLKPLILLPVSLVTRLTPLQVEAILIHELFHIRRNDYLFNMLMSCFRNLFFFNPFAQLFYKAVARERELACDDGVLEMHYPAALYAEALFCLEKFRQVRPGFSIAADGNRPWFLMERIRRVLGRPERKKKKSNPIWLFSLVLAFGFFGLQKKSTQHTAFLPPPPVQKAAVVSNGSLLEVKKETVSEISVKAIVRHKVFKKLSMRILPETVAIVETPGEQDPPEDVSFADHHMIRDFSNQQTAGTVRKPLRVYPGTPYVPSVSLSYEEVPGAIAADSMREMMVSKGMKEMMTAYRLNTSARLKQLEKSLEKNNALLKNMEIKNQPLILLRDNNNDKKLLDHLQKQVERTKLEIDQLQMQLQISDEEIIRI